MTRTLILGLIFLSLNAFAAKEIKVDVIDAITTIEIEGAEAGFLFASLPGENEVISNGLVGREVMVGITSLLRCFYHENFFKVLSCEVKLPKMNKQHISVTGSQETKVSSVEFQKSAAVVFKKFIDNHNFYEKTRNGKTLFRCNASECKMFINK